MNDKQRPPRNMSYERGCQEKKLPRGRMQRMFLNIQPWLSERARSISESFFWMVFSRKPGCSHRAKQ